MIHIRARDGRIEIAGHAARDRDGNPTCCAAVSAAVQQAILWYAMAGADPETYASPVEESGGFAMIDTRTAVGQLPVGMQAAGRLTADTFITVIKMMAKAWPGEIEIEE